MSGKFTSLLAACAATLVIFAATSPALARKPITVTATAEPVAVRYVSYRDLNLAKADDEKMLVKRVSFATRDACHEAARGQTVELPILLNCREEAWQGARPQIKNAVLRARQIATNGWSAIAPVAISISVR